MHKRRSNDMEKAPIERAWARARNDLRKDPSAAKQFLGRRLDEVDVLARRIAVTSGMVRGSLPDFLIVGAQKCGTSSLAKSLQAHPEVTMAQGLRPQGVEVHFFDSRLRLARGGEPYYRSFFRSPESLQGEKTPEYLSGMEVHEQMHAMLPDTKLIVTLRNPVDRAYSQWNHELQTNTIPRMSFEDALETKADLLDRGRYIDQIESLLRYYPPDQLLVLILEHTRENPEADYLRTLSFLGLQPAREAQYKLRHRRKYETTMRAALRAQLLQEFAPWNARLENFLGFDLPEWRQ